MRCALYVSLAVVLLSCVSPGYAWNRAGHMLSGALAYKEMSPASRTKVVQLLKKHPDFTARWQGLIARFEIPAASEELFLFTQAARWPDDIRGTPLHREFDHFINHPFVPMGQPSSVRPTPPADENIEVAFRANEKTLKDTTRSDADRAMALCWLFHQIGDVHQPLHTSQLFTTRFRQGDRGGTRFFIRATESSSTIGLHKFWDDLLTGSERFSSVESLAIVLRNRTDLERSDFPQIASTKKFEDWSKKESFQLAQDVAYLNGVLEGSTDDENGEVLPDGYAALAKGVAEKQMMLAGYRLADFLNAAF